MNSEIENWHPKLKGKKWKIIDVEFDLIKFNCFSFVIDIYDDWSGASTKSWTLSNRKPILENYIKFFSLHGFELCDNETYEKNFEKIAIYIDEDGYVTHAAKQFNDMWRSKLGSHEIIEHKLEWLSGYDFNNYGKVGTIMKKNIINW